MNLVTAEELEAAAPFPRPFFFLLDSKQTSRCAWRAARPAKGNLLGELPSRVLVGFGIDFVVCLESNLACKRQIARRAAFKGGAKHAGNIPEPSHKAWECLNQQRDSAPVPTIFLRLLSGCW